MKNGRSHLCWVCETKRASAQIYCFAEEEGQHHLSAAIRDLDLAAQVNAAVANIVADDRTGFPDCPRPCHSKVGKLPALHILGEPSPVTQMEVVARHEPGLSQLLHEIARPFCDLALALLGADQVEVIRIEAGNLP